MRRPDDCVDHRDPAELGGGARRGDAARRVHDDAPRRARRRPGLSDPELAAGFGDLPRILTADEAARLLRISKSTLYHHVCRGRYRTAVVRGRPLRFVRDRLVREFFRP